MSARDYFRHSAKVIRSRRWKAFRLLVLRRDGFKCVACGSPRDLEVDHRVPVRDAQHLAFDGNNAQTLCSRCHARKTRLELGFPTVSPERMAWRKLVDEGKLSDVGKRENSTASERNPLQAVRTRWA